MNKQKKIIIALCLLAGLAVGGSSAYFVTQTKTRNIITTGGVSVVILETTSETNQNGEPVLFENIDNAIPGETYSKIPQVKNIDSGLAYVRIRIDKTATLSDGTVINLADDSLTLDLDESNWLYSADGYYYYNQALPADELTAPLFTRVTIKDDLLNIYNGATFSLKLTAHAVQANNNGTSVLTAEGWPEE